MKKLSLFVAAVVLSAGWAAAGGKHEHGKAAAGKSGSFTGEIVDLNCYMGHETSGEKHENCAKMCVKGGAPMGLKTGGDLYLLVGDHAAEKAFATAKELAGGKAKITGRVENKGGLRALVVTAAEKAS
jgi:hypothetical protein